MNGDAGRTDATAGGAVLREPTGRALADAVRAHTLTQEEIHLVAIWWAYMVMARQRGEIDPTFFQLRINERVMALAARWPGTFRASETGRTSQALIRSPDDFACGASCAPSPQLFSSAAQEAIGTALDSLAKGTTFGSVCRVFRIAKDAHDVGVSLGMSAGDALVMALRNPSATIDSRTLLMTVGYALSAAGTVASAAGLLGIGGPTVAAIASVGAAVQAVTTARDVVGTFRGAAELFQQCRSWRTSNCPEPDPDDGMPLPPPPTEDPFEPLPPPQPTDILPTPAAPCAPLSSPDAGCVPEPDSCPDNSIVCGCPETHGVWCHPPVCEPGGPSVDCGGGGC